MKIAIVTAAYPPYLSGTSNVCRHHAQALARQGHQVHIFTPQRAGKTEQTGDEVVAVTRLRPLLRSGNAALLPQLLWRLRGFDIIHWHYPFFGGAWTALAAILTQTPLFVTYHQDVILTGWRGSVARLWENSIGRLALRSAEKVIFTSEGYAQASRFRPLLRTHQITAIPNGVDTNHFSLEQPLPTKQFTALLVAGLGNAHYFKGVALFLNALQQLPTIHAVIVGDGNLRPSYEAQAHRLGIAQRVTFTGRVNDSELPAYYRNADVAVLPSTTMGEAFGLVLLESLACCTPVIASDLPGVRTVVNDGQDGLLIRPNDCQDLVAKLRQMQRYGAAQRTRMGHAGRRKVERHYTWAAIGQQLNTLYQTHTDRSQAYAAAA